MLKGIDISMWQGDIDLRKMSEQVDFIIIKSSEGVGYIDPKFDRNRLEARKLGLLRGYYHFARPDLGNSATDEANWFCTVLGDLQEGEILVLDYEPSWNVSSESQVRWCKTFLEAIENRLGYKAMIYLNGNQNRTMDWNPIVANGNGLWLATYPYGEPDLKNPPATDWPFIAIWQYTSSGRLDGYSGNLDLNVFYGDKRQYLKYGYKGIDGTPTPDPIPEPEEVIGETYTVVSGDTLSGIAAKFNTTYQELARINNIANPNLIFPGQIIKLSSQTVTDENTYIVKSGDTLSGIAEVYNTSYKKLAEINGIKDPNLIFPGQAIKLG